MVKLFQEFFGEPVNLFCVCIGLYLMEYPLDYLLNCVPVCTRPEQ
jgi:hypothetical protein